MASLGGHRVVGELGSGLAPFGASAVTRGVGESGGMYGCWAGGGGGDIRRTDTHDDAFTQHPHLFYNHMILISPLLLFSLTPPHPLSVLFWSKVWATCATPLPTILAN